MKLQMLWGRLGSPRIARWPESASELNVSESARAILNTLGCVPTIGKRLCLSRVLGILGKPVKPSADQVGHKAL